MEANQTKCEETALPLDKSLIEKQLQDFIGRYFRHVVGLAGVYEHIGANGTQIPKQPFYYSATVLEVSGCWYLVTAGHILEKMEAATTRQDMRLVAVDIDDSYAPGAPHKHPIKYFAYQDAGRFYRNEKGGLDFGMIQLRQNYRDLLAANGVLPLVTKHWDESEIASCNAFLMCGFPEDSINTSISDGQHSYVAAVKPTPCVVWVERSKASAAEARFVGKVGDQEKIGSIKGMSGGPVFCLRDTDTDDESYFVAGIQSSWDPEKRLTFACPIPSILAAAHEFLAIQ